MAIAQQEHNKISGQFLFQVYQSCQKLGARKPVLLDAVKFTEVEVRHPDRGFDEAEVTALFRATSCELKKQNVAFDIGKAMLSSGFSDPGYGALFESSVETALRKLLASYADDGYEQLRIERSRIGNRLVCDTRSKYSRTFIHLLFSEIFYFLNVIISSRIQPIAAMHFAHPKPDGFDDHGRSFSTPFYFEQPANFIQFNEEVLEQANPHCNMSVLEYVEAQRNSLIAERFETKPLSKLAYQYLLFHLDKSGLSLDAAAETFGIAERTFRRKLVAEGNSFRHILETVRRDTCQLYFLEANRPLSEIATKLGYSELSALTRAYTAWHGHPPSHDLQCHTAKAA